MYVNSSVVERKQSYLRAKDTETVTEALKEVLWHFTGGFLLKHNLLEADVITSYCFTSFLIIILFPFLASSKG